MSSTATNSCPDGWQPIAVADLGEISSGGTPRRNIPRFWGGEIPWVTPTEITGLRDKWLADTREKITPAGLAGSAAKLLPEGSVVVTTRATLGGVAIARVPLTTNQGFKNIVPNGETDPLFCYYVIQTVRPELMRRATGTTFLEISKGDFAGISLNRAPMTEQVRIAEFLDMVDVAIRETDAVLRKLRQVKAGLLHDLLTLGIDRHGKVRDPIRHPEEFQESPLGRIPKTWKLISVERAGEVTLGRQRSPQHERGLHLTPYLRVANVFDGWIDYSDVLRMNFAPQEQETFGLVPGDILLNEGQSLELVGRSAIYRGPPSKYCFQNTLVRFRCFSDSVPEFCRLVFKYWLDRGRFTLVARQTTSVAHLGADRFAKMAFARPHPDEQKEIAANVSTATSRTELEEANLSKLQFLKRGLAADLLTGRVRVKV